MAEWNEFSVHINKEAVEAVSNILIELGSAGVSVSDRNDFLEIPEYQDDTLWELNEADFPKDGVIIKGYFHQQHNLDEIEKEIKLRVEKLKEYDLDIDQYQIERTDVEQEEWANAWKKHYHPVPISRFLTIVPQWEEYEPLNRDEKVITLDPGLAFGTGTHPTTRLCLQSLENLIRGGETVIDVGTGSGVLSIASSLFGAENIFAYDLDETAVKSASDNVKLNQLDSDISIGANDLLKGINHEADIIVANILADIIIPLIPDAFKLLKPDGVFLSSGIIKDKKDQVIEELKRNGFSIYQVNQIDDWIAIIAKK